MTDLEDLKKDGSIVTAAAMAAFASGIRDTAKALRIEEPVLPADLIAAALDDAVFVMLQHGEVIAQGEHQQRIEELVAQAARAEREVEKVTRDAIDSRRALARAEREIAERDAASVRARGYFEGIILSLPPRLREAGEAYAAAAPDRLTDVEILGRLFARVLGHG